MDPGVLLVESADPYGSESFLQAGLTPHISGQGCLTHFNSNNTLFVPSRYQCGLDLFHNRQVFYGWFESGKLTEPGKFRSQDVVGFTNKCAVALVVNNHFQGGACFPVVKNAGLQWAFAEENTAHLIAIIAQMSKEWAKYRCFDPAGHELFWFFNFCGFACFEGHEPYQWF